MVHDTYRSPLLDRTMETITRAADRQTLLASALLIATFDGDRGPDTAKLLSVSLVAGQVATSFGKLVANRARPDGYSPRSNSSFPSGHAAASFGMATILADRYDIPSPLLYSGASMVAVSRVYLGRHYPSDVVVGGLIGYGCGRLVLHFQDRIGRIRIGRRLGIHLTATPFFVSLQAGT